MALPLLSVLVWLPIVGGIVVMLLGSERATLGKQMALGTSVLTFVLSIPLYTSFLSPAPMERLFAKAKAEMKPGSLFISNSFHVPNEPPTRIVELDDKRQTQLFVWEL